MENYIFVCAMMVSVGPMTVTIEGAGENSKTLVPIISPRSWQSVVDAQKTDTLRPSSDSRVIHCLYDPDLDDSDDEYEYSRKFSTDHMLERRKLEAYPYRDSSSKHTYRKKSAPVCSLKDQPIDTDEKVEKPSDSNLLGRKITLYLQSPRTSPYTLKQLLKSLPKNFIAKLEDIITYKCESHHSFLSLFTIYRSSKELFSFIEQSSDGLESRINPYHTTIDDLDIINSIYKANRALKITASTHLQDEPLSYFLTLGAPADLSEDEKAKILKEISKNHTLTFKYDDESRSLSSCLDTSLSSLPLTTFANDCELIQVHQEFLSRCKQKQTFVESKNFFESLP